MALSVWAIGTGTVDVGVSTVIDVTLTASAAVGDLVSGWMVVQSNGTLSSVTDTKGNTWTIRTPYVVSTSKYYFVDSVLTSALEIGDVISMTCSTAANRKYAVFQAINGQAASYFDQEGAGATGTSANPSITTGTLAQANSVIIGCVYSVFDQVTVEGAGYTGLTTAVLTNRYMHSSYHIVNSTDPDTYAPTLGSSREWQTNYIVYKGADAPPAIDDEAFCLLGVG